MANKDGRVADTLADVAVQPTIDGSTTTELANDDIRNQWQHFHKVQARLRAVSIQANLSILRRR